MLADQAGEALTLLRAISDERSLFRYAPDKWSIRELVGHLNDAERVFFVPRVLVCPRIRGPAGQLRAGRGRPVGDGRTNGSGTDMLDEFAAIRAATVALFEGCPMPRGIAVGWPVVTR